MKNAAPKPGKQVNGKKHKKLISSEQSNQLSRLRSDKLLIKPSMLHSEKMEVFRRLTNQLALESDKESKAKMATAARSVWQFGTQHITIEVHGTTTAATSSAGGIIAATYDVKFSNMVDVSAWAVAFDEYRFINATLLYQPFAQNTYNNAVTIGYVPGAALLYIDYDDAAAPTGLDAAWGHDTCSASCTNQQMLKFASFHAPPDDNWITTATTSTVVGTFKFYAQALTASISYGNFFVRAKMEFRTAQ